MQPMFLRRNRKRAGGEAYEYWTLCEAVRTERGPRQRIVATLGKLEPEARQTQSDWSDIDALLEGRPPARQLHLGQRAPEEQPLWRRVDIRGVRVERAREFGEVYLGLALWRRLGLHQLLRELLPQGRESVPWEPVACVLTLARFCAQRSELGVAESWYETHRARGSARRRCGADQ